MKIIRHAEFISASRLSKITRITKLFSTSLRDIRRQEYDEAILFELGIASPSTSLGIAMTSLC